LRLLIELSSLHEARKFLADRNEPLYQMIY